MNPRKIMFTLYAESYVCYAQCIQQLPPVKERMVIFTLPILTGLHDQTAWIIISALINSKKPIAWKKLNAFHYSTETWSDLLFQITFYVFPVFVLHFVLTGIVMEAEFWPTQSVIFLSAWTGFGMCPNWNAVARMSNFKKYLNSHSGMLPTTRAWYPV